MHHSDCKSEAWFIHPITAGPAQTDRNHILIQDDSSERLAHSNTDFVFPRKLTDYCPIRPQLSPVPAAKPARYHPIYVQNATNFTSVLILTHE